ncbi:DUF3990 domain-containing protein [Bacteroides thetaiotaomicron]|jgi:hypothetical protein|uniref:DUF3990 domain-containing protein n=1 Tax=Bacteroides thetaiotaomicron TaxID=818 RepID=UPI001CE267BE|nr:DUF3990 domain-containing protein [Bacteroides thetaiotaomicron]MCA6009140.1 DUF3990 domain-containing protein [Bacteroides thetaiotaomicron]UVS51798.1 DUF3990 domain-containing protein [Bacteroides thetaiotaomicron]
MILYHGTTVDIEKIDLQKSKPNKDFGKGFYLSADKEQAVAMADYKAAQIEGISVVNAFEFDERNLEDTSLKVKIFKEYDKEWADFIFANRNNPSSVSVHNYDVVIGPIANDRVGLQIRKYMDEEIDLPTFIERLKYMKGITIQYYFGTERAISLLKKI